MSDMAKKLTKFAKELLDKKSLEQGLPFISKYAKEIINADRCSIFIFDKNRDKLWTTIADGVEKIVIDKDSGIAGHTLKSKKPVIANNAYENKDFLADIDKQTGYKTKNIASVPIFDSNRESIGVLELLNKEGGFNDDDIKFMTFFAHYISGFIELIYAYKDYKY